VALQRRSGVWRKAKTSPRKWRVNEKDRRDWKSKTKNYQFFREKKLPENLIKMGRSLKIQKAAKTFAERERDAIDNPAAESSAREGGSRSKRERRSVYISERSRKNGSDTPRGSITTKGKEET